MSIRRILILALVLVVGGVASAADIDSAQNMRISQEGTQNNVDISSGVINTVDMVTNMGTMSTLTTVTEVKHVTDMDNLDVVGSVNKGTVTIQSRTGGYDWVIGSDGAGLVRPTSEVGTAKKLYVVSTAVAANTEIEAASYTVTTGKTLYLNCIKVVASGEATLRLLAGTEEIDALMSSPTYKSPIGPTYQGISVPAGTIVKIMLKNRETAAMDIRGLMVGIEK